MGLVAIFPQAGETPAALSDLAADRIRSSAPFGVDTVANALRPCFESILQNRSQLRRDRAYAGFILAIFGPTPFGGVNSAREVAARYRMTEQNLHTLAGRYTALLERSLGSGAEIEPSSLSNGYRGGASRLDPDEAHPELDGLRDALRRMSLGLLRVVHKQTSKARDRALAAFSLLIFGAEVFGGPTSPQEVAMRYGLTPAQLAALIGEFDQLLSTDPDTLSGDGSGI